MSHSRQFKVGAGGRYGAFSLVDGAFGFCAGGLGSAQVRLEIPAVQHDERLAGLHVVAGLHADFENVGGDFRGDSGAIAGTHTAARLVDIGDFGSSNGFDLDGGDAAVRRPPRRTRVFVL